MSIDKLIQEKILAFATELSQLVREAAVAQVRAAFDSGAAAPAAAARGSRPAKPAAGAPARAAAPAKAATAARPAKAASGGSRAKGAKRPPGEIAAMVENVATWVAANGGRRVEEMGAALGVPTAELTLPIKKLIKAGRIRAEGQKRATKYHAASAAPAASAAKRPAAKRPAAKRPAAKRRRK